MYSNVYVFPVVCLHLLGMYSNACYATKNNNRMRQSDLALDQCWLTHNSYFRLATTVVLGMAITDGKLLFCHVLSEVNVDNKVSTVEYNNRTVYDCFNNPFPDDFGRPYLNPPPITIDDRPRLHKRYRYTPDLLPDNIYVASEKYVSTLTTPSVLPQLLLLASSRFQRSVLPYFWTRKI